MHTVWKGAISFGLVHVPVKMHSATEDKDISLRMIHSVCGSPLNYVRQCPVCDTEVAWNDIVKGYEYEKGHFVLFTKDELDTLQDDANRAIAILDFVDLTQIDPIYYQKTYYLSPDQAGGNAYQLLREALSSTNKIGIAKVTLRAKSSLAAIRVLDNCLVMETMHYPDEIRSSGQVPNIPENIHINPKELEMAQVLINQLSSHFEPEKYTDEYRERLLTRIQEKITGKEITTAPAASNEPPIVDLMAALQASIQAMQPVVPDSGAAAASGIAGAQAGGAARQNLATQAKAVPAVDDTAATSATRAASSRRSQAQGRGAAKGQAGLDPASAKPTAGSRKRRTAAGDAAAADSRKRRNVAGDAPAASSSAGANSAVAPLTAEPARTKRTRSRKADALPAAAGNDSAASAPAPRRRTSRSADKP